MAAKNGWRHQGDYDAELARCFAGKVNTKEVLHKVFFIIIEWTNLHGSEHVPDESNED